MPREHRIRVYWSGRKDELERLGQQISLLLTVLPSVHPRLAGFHFDDRRTGAPAPADTRAACQEALVQATVTWSTGNTQRTSYRPRFFLEHDGRLAAEIKITCGIDPIDLGADLAAPPIFAPNRLDIALREGAVEDSSIVATIENALRAVVAIYRPDWGHAGSASVPDPPVAFFSDGAPVVGWMTYLSASYPPLPEALPRPAVAQPVSSLGTLIVAHPEAFRDDSVEHLAAVSAVRDALATAGVLVPAGPPAARQ